MGFPALQHIQSFGVMAPGGCWVQRLLCPKPVELPERAMERERKPVERHCLGPGLQSLMFDGF